TAKVNITSLRVRRIDDKESEQMNEQVKRMIDEGEVTLAFNQNSFNVIFEAINYRFSGDIVYQYRLDGYDEGWSAPSDEGEAIYTKVSAGSYVMRVRCLRQSDGKPLDEVRLRITVSKPWYFSLGAIFTYVCLLSLIGVAAFRYKYQRIKEHQNQEKIRFFVQMAHDIRTPLTLIAAPLEDLSHDTSLTSEAHYLLNTALKGSRRLRVLIGELLNFERLDRGRGTLRCVPVCLGDLVIEQGENFLPLCERSGLKLHVDVPNQSIYCLADSELMLRMLDNLMGNACKYTPAGGDIFLTLTTARRKAIITVRDTGIGMSEEIKRTALNRIARGENVRGIEGTGFGLVQTNQMVKAMGGHIRLESQEGQGTTFTITFRLT
ncbi:MAG: hybrid sensor histidine kinase/response regulator, partial [Bacteroidaceae bacterium]|nr:hybrid sensor histidine kinase/response regulator [Bacteroidaceae bacterium]